jgi:hypothetical protein
MNPVEWVADRLPRGLVRPTSFACVACGALGSAFLFAAVVFGSIVWALVGIGAFVVAAFLWHIVAHASEVRRVPSRTSTL